MSLYFHTRLYTIFENTSETAYGRGHIMKCRDQANVVLRKKSTRPENNLLQNIE